MMIHKDDKRPLDEDEISFVSLIRQGFVYLFLSVFMLFSGIGLSAFIEIFFDEFHEDAFRFVIFNISIGLMSLIIILIMVVIGVVIVNRRARDPPNHRLLPSKFVEVKSIDGKLYDIEGIFKALDPLFVILYGFLVAGTIYVSIEAFIWSRYQLAKYLTLGTGVTVFISIIFIRQARELFVEKQRNPIYTCMRDCYWDCRENYCEGCCWRWSTRRDYSSV
jgi:hypothetical protein